MVDLIRETAFRLYQRLELREPQLTYLFLELTRRCNLRCLHCGSDCQASSTAAELTTESWCKIISYVAERFGRQVTFVITGGEPLVHPDLCAVAGHIASLGMRWGMVTNGMALTRERLAALCERGLYSITLSLDGQTASHNTLRNHPHAFAKVVEALAMVGDSAIPMKDVVTCVYPANLGELDEVAEILIDRRIPAWRLFRIFPIGRAASDPSLMLTHAQTWQLLDWIAERRPQLAKRGLKVNASCEGYVPFADDRRIRDQPFFCRAGVNIASVLCDGHITGCTNNDPTFFQGNILHDDLVTVWRERFASYRRRDWVAKTSCRSCPEVQKCNGGSIHLWRLGAEAPAFCYCPRPTAPSALDSGRGRRR
ncbi:MAG: radical SAM protein [Polyangiaceae bacterium]|nr:radical SAM protein [Polyangiaceae bacterium]